MVEMAFVILVVIMQVVERAVSNVLHRQLQSPMEDVQV